MFAETAYETPHICKTGGANKSALPRFGVEAGKLAVVYVVCIKCHQIQLPVENCNVAAAAVTNRSNFRGVAGFRRPSCTSEKTMLPRRSSVDGFTVANRKAVKSTKLCTETVSNNCFRRCPGVESE